MIICKTVQTLSKYLDPLRRNKKIGFVPTMGALHEGHRALIRQAVQQTDLAICSIFVNPTQFNDANDFKKYPVTIEKDIYLLEKAGTHILFLPSVNEIYLHGTESLETYPLGYLETILEGKYRPGHFQGVCQVMRRLLDATMPHFLFMGRKDYQQCMVVQRLIDLMHAPISLQICPTVREADGLAMSSRNLRLSPNARKNAPAIYQALQFIRQHITAGRTLPLIENANEILQQHTFKVDYVSIADKTTLMPVENWDGQQQLVALIAAFQDDVRLIDNLLLNDAGKAA